MATILKQTAYIPSASEYDKAWGKYRAFMSAKLSQKAKENGAHEGDTYKAGYFFTRSACAGSSCRVFCGNVSGTRGWGGSIISYAGLRVAFNLIYNRKCTLVKGCEMQKRTQLVYENGDHSPVYDKNGDSQKVTSTAPIITLENGTKCIWLNKDECEKGEDKTIQLWTLDLVEKAEPFAENGDHNDWAKAEKLHNQCERWVENNLSDEEKAMLVPVEMSSEDGYDKATPILEQEKHLTNTALTDLKNAFSLYKKGLIDSQGFMKIVDKLQPIEYETLKETQKDE